jgi:hypothetical protein
MTPLPILLIPLSALVAMGFVWFVFVHARRARLAPDCDGVLTLSYGWPMRGFAILALFGGETLFATWILMYPPQTSRTVVLLCLGSMVLGVLGSVLLWEVFRFRLQLRPDELDCRSPWRARVVSPWSGVRQVRFSSANVWFVVDTLSGTFCVSATVPGVRYFLEECLAKLPPEQLTLAEPGFTWVGYERPKPSRST